MEPLKLGLIGLGTVASGVAAVLHKNQQTIARRIRQTPIIERVYVRSLERENPYKLNLTTDIDEIISNSEIDIVIELIGGIEPALSYIKTALRNGKSVITANKELIAKHGAELLTIAAENGVFLRFEAAVAGGIPILKSLREGLAANEIDTVMGIINGTTNYILTEMSSKGSDFAICLKEAQAHGYAEADPTFDIEGIDAAHKLTILASTAFGIPLQFDAIYTEGITQISANDIAIAQREGFAIKHLGIAKKGEQGVELRVHPTLIPLTHPFAQVQGVLNGIFIQGNAVGEQFMSGRGAGSEATASAVIADLIEIAHNQLPDYSAPALGFNPNQLIKVPLITKNQFKSHYYIACEYDTDTPSVLVKALKERAAEILKIDFNIKIYDENHTIIILTKKTIEENVEKLMNNVILKEGIVRAKSIRIEMF